MNNEILCAPLRLIAIHSGKFEFAEVMLDAPLHLMGPNNIGKTSLIAMLQFLYLDDQRYMHFSHTMAETRRYYFPHINSYILFECRTPEGFRVVAVHGLGPARQYEFERFTYRGRYALSDYLTEDRCMREPDDVKAQLAGKGFVKLEPRHLRAALSGVGDDRDVRLGLVPLRDRSQYERFRFLFCNLLRLAQLRQDELKALLIEIYRNEFQQMTVDLSVEYRERFERVKRDAQAIQELRWIEKDILQLFELIDKRNTIRGELPILWLALGRLFSAQEATYREQEIQKQAEREQLQVQEKNLQTEQRSLEEQRDEQMNQRGALRARLDDFQAEEKSFADFVPDWARQRLHDLEKETRMLQARLGNLEGERPEQIKKRLKILNKDHDKTRQIRDSIEKLLLTQLRTVFSDEELAPLFQLLNPALLTLSNECVTIDDREAIIEQLRQLIKRCSEGTYQDDTLTIDLSPMDTPDLAQMTDARALQETIDELQRQIKQQKALLEAARNRSKLEDSLKQFNTERHDLELRLARWQAMEEKKKEAETWLAEIQQLDAQTLALRQQLDQLSKEIQTIEKKRQHLTDAIQSAEKQRIELLERQRRLQAPAEDWPQTEEIVNLSENFDDLYESYRRAHTRERQLTEETALLMNVVQKSTYEKYQASTEADTLKRLAGAIDALGNKEAALHKAWTDMTVGLRSSFSALAHDLDRLQGKVTELNRRIGKVDISNLESVRLIVSERAEWTKRIRTVCNLQDDLPLFGQQTEASPEMKELGALLEQTSSISLCDLFDLHFEIEGTNKKTRIYTNLDKIESNGTTITIKVLIHLILLRDLMSGGRARIPFYLDEVSSLDHDNIAGIIQQATTLDFVPVLASPESVEEVQRIYMLSENDDGGIVLDEHAMIELRHNDATD